MAPYCDHSSSYYTFLSQTVAFWTIKSRSGLVNHIRRRYGVLVQSHYPCSQCYRLFKKQGLITMSGSSREAPLHNIRHSKLPRDTSCRWPASLPLQNAEQKLACVSLSYVCLCVFVQSRCTHNGLYDHGRILLSVNHTSIQKPHQVQFRAGYSVLAKRVRFLTEKQRNS